MYVCVCVCARACAAVMLVVGVCLCYVTAARQDTDFAATSPQS